MYEGFAAAWRALPARPLKRRGRRPLPQADLRPRPTARLEHIPLRWNIARVDEVIGALGRREGVEPAADGAPEVVDAWRPGAAEQRLQLGEDLLDRIEIGALGWQIGEFGALGLDYRTPIEYDTIPPPEPREGSTAGLIAHPQPDNSGYWLSRTLR